jgi:hypothetical protein
MVEFRICVQGAVSWLAGGVAAMQKAGHYVPSC